MRIICAPENHDFSVTPHGDLFHRPLRAYGQAACRFDWVHSAENNPAPQTPASEPSLGPSFNRFVRDRCRYRRATQREPGRLDAPTRSAYCRERSCVLDLASRFACPPTTIPYHQHWTVSFLENNVQFVPPKIIVNPIRIA